MLHVDRNAKKEIHFLLRCLVLCLLGVFAGFAFAEAGPLLSDNFSYAVRLVLPRHEKAVLGSGFYYHHRGSTYLVTARHVLFASTQVPIKDGTTFALPVQLLHRIRYDKNSRLLNLDGVLSIRERDEILVQPSTNESGKRAIQYLYEKSQRLALKAHIATVFTCAPGRGELELRLTAMLIKGLIKYHPVHDVAVIRLEGPTSCGMQSCMNFVSEVRVIKSQNLTALDAADLKLMHDVVTGSKVFVLGFTSSTTEETFPECKQPVLMEGAVAGKNKELGIVLDCAAYPGDSGGLVLEVDEGSEEKHVKGIGVMSGVLRYEKDRQDSKKYSFAAPLDALLELLD